MAKTATPAKTLYAVRIDANLLDAARRVQKKTGAPVTWQIETSLRRWLISQGELKPTTRKQGRK
jgi:hypothetical protein